MDIRSINPDELKNLVAKCNSLQDQDDFGNSNDGSESLTDSQVNSKYYTVDG